MESLMRMRILGFLLMLVGFHSATCQEPRSPIQHSGISAPVGLTVGGSIDSITQNSAFVIWFPDSKATYYRLRLYRRDDDELVREITNLRSFYFRVNDLDPGTNYSVSISAVYRNAQGIMVESPESDPQDFTTREECYGGQVWTECDGHCIAKCDDPDPVCSRVCSPGCNCPTESSVWDGGRCIEASSCPPETGIPVMVQNLHVLNSVLRENSVILAWNVHEGAYIYEVTVRLAEDRNVVVQSHETQIPIIGISNLTAGEIYAFGVVAYVRRVDSVASRSALLPPPAYAVNITKTSFGVVWLDNPDAVRYSFVLYDETRMNILYENEKIAGNSVLMEDLFPGTTYFFAIAAAGRNEHAGIFSPLTQVTTLGARNESDHRREAIIIERIEPPITSTPMVMIRNRTACLSEYQSVIRFYERFPNASNGPRYRKCDEHGQYETTLCESDRPNSCKCITADTGRPLKASEFGGDNSDFPLNCDAYGTLTDKNLTLEVTRIRTNNIKISWSRFPESLSYIVFIRNVDTAGEGKTISVNPALDSYIFRDLASGTDYEIGVYAASATGGTSPLVTVQTTTSFVDRPRQVQILSSTNKNLTITWAVSPSVEMYTVRLMVGDTVMENVNEITRNMITFRNLKNQKRYNVEIRAIGFEYTADSDEPIYHYSLPSNIEVSIHCKIPPLDLIFVLETSPPTTWSHLQNMKKVASELLLELPRLNASTGTRVAVVRYRDVSNVIFNFDRFKKTGNAYGAIRYIRTFSQNKANLEKALVLVQRSFFDRPLRAGYTRRNNAKSIVIVFTSNQKPSTSTQRAARRLRSETNVIAVGVNGWSSRFGLSTVASSDDLVFSAPSFTALGNSKTEILEKICSVVAN